MNRNGRSSNSSLYVSNSCSKLSPTDSNMTATTATTRSGGTIATARTTSIATIITGATVHTGPDGIHSNETGGRRFAVRNGVVCPVEMSGSISNAQRQQEQGRTTNSMTTSAIGTSTMVRVQVKWSMSKKPTMSLESR